MVDKVKGYKELTQEKVDVVNVLKVLEEHILRNIETEIEDCVKNDADPRWLSIAFTDFQRAFMSLNRGIFNPGRVELPEDKIEDPAE